MEPQRQEAQQDKTQRRTQISFPRWVIISLFLLLAFLFLLLSLTLTLVQGIAQAASTLTIISIIFGVIVTLLGWMLHLMKTHRSASSHSLDPSPASSLPSAVVEQRSHPSVIPSTSSQTPAAPASIMLPAPASSDVQREPLVDNVPHVDWGEAPHTDLFYGRDRELTEVQQWILDDQCRVIAILGVGGIGKTALTAVLTERVHDAFAWVFWRSLQHAPPLKQVLQACITFLSNQQHALLPEDEEGQIALLLDYVRKQHCFLIFDNMEAILQEGKHAGLYREGYEGYGRLLQRLGETAHQSCVLLTSREKPKELALLEGKRSSVRSIQLEGLQPSAGRALLQDKVLHGTKQRRDALITRYAGNPLSLRLVSQFIVDVYDGDLAQFLTRNEIIFHDLRDVLDQQFERLSPLEQAVMYWLAIEREAVSTDILQADMVSAISMSALHEALQSLRRRHLIEIRSTGISLQNVIMEYVTQRFVAHVSAEITGESVALFETHALMQAMTKEYLRESQVRLILHPLARHLLAVYGQEDLERRCKSILVLLRETYPRSSGYAAGNILNLLVQGGYDLSGSDFSGLTLRQAYLQEAILDTVTFAQSHFDTTLFTHTFGRVHAVAFRPQGDMLAAGTETGEIWCWRISDRTFVLVCQGHTNWVNAVAFSPDGKTLASGSSDHTIRVWEVKTGQCLQVLHGHTQRIHAVSFSPDGHLLASGSEDQTIRVWDVRTGQALSTFQGQAKSGSPIAFSPDGYLLASGNIDHTIRLWEVNTARCLATLPGHVDEITSIAFSPDGYLLASGGIDHTIRLWEVNTAHCLATLPGHTNWIQSVAFSPDGRTLASGSYDQTIRLWEVKTGRCLRILHGHTYAVAVAFSPDGQTLASGSHDQTIRLWDLRTGHCFHKWQGYMNEVRSVAFSPDGQTLASGSHDQTIRLWEVKTGRCLRILHGHTQEVRSVAFSPDGETLVSGSADQTVRLWEVRSGSHIRTFSGHSKEVVKVAFHPSGHFLASCGYEYDVRLWEVSTGRCLRILQGHSAIVSAIAFRSDGSLLASGSSDGTLRLWEVSTGRCVRILQDSSVIVTLAFSPDGRLLVSAGTDQSIRLWEVNTGHCLFTLPGHVDLIRSVAFRPDGHAFASGSDDQTIRLWETSSGRCLATLLGQSGKVQSVAFAPDGQVLVSGHSDGIVKLWALNEGTCVKTLRCNKPYEGMNMTNVTGLTGAQKAMLKALGAVEDEAHSDRHEEK